MNSSLSFFFCIILLHFSIYILSLSSFASLTPELCHPDQRDALLEFKTEFMIQEPDGFLDLYGDLINVTSYPKTNSWKESTSDCCNWDGVTCDNILKNVIGLDLSCSCLHGRLESNSSLFRLKHLQSLNLAYNNFILSPIPAKFSELMGLKTLNLSVSSFAGQIPIEILQLTNLVSLDFSSYNQFSQNLLSIENPPLFLHLLAQNFKNLRALDLSSVNISSEIPKEFSYMWSLRSLHLVGCNLIGEFPSNVLLIPNLESIRLDFNPHLRGKLPDFRGNNSMQILSLLETSFSGIVPESISNLIHLTSLTLQESNFFGRIPSSLGKLSSLSRLLLSSNHFVGEIPSSIGNLKQLTFFSIVNNKFRGNFPSALLNLTKLRGIGLSSNQFTGLLPPNISQLSKLEHFYASDNFFTGAIPASLFKISSLTNIYLSDNQLSDLAGIEDIYMLPSLQYLFIHRNKYKVSPVDLNVFSSLKQLVGLALSGIPLSTANFTSDSDFSWPLKYLYLSGCNITEFPEFIRDRRNLESLDLSNNNINGQIPDWLWRLQALDVLDLSSNSLSGFKGSLKILPRNQITMLHLSSNAFQGPLFIPSTFINYLFASKNNFTGEIPQSICGLTSPFIIDLSNNNFHGSVPRCLVTHMSSLSDLNLRNNSLTGSIPDIFIDAKKLRSIDVSHNQLKGKLPASLTGCSALEVLNVESNQIKDTFPLQLNSLPKLQVLVLRSNQFQGMLHHSDGSWFGFSQLKIIDVSHNDFLGTLPSDYFLNWTSISSKEDNYTQLSYIGDFHDYGYYTSVILMNKGISMEMERILTVYTAIDFSGNKIHGKVPESIGLLKELHVLNLSRNAFNGHIPSSLANLTVLESLDISQNKLSGEIPPKLGDLSSLGWINVSHNQLVGPIPQGTQFQRQNCSSYEGNTGLYGPSLKDICGDIHTQTLPEEEVEEDKEEEEEENISWIAAGLGFVPGIVFGLTIGYIVVHEDIWQKHHSLAH